MTQDDIKTNAVDPGAGEGHVRALEDLCNALLELARNDPDLPAPPGMRKIIKRPVESLDPYVSSCKTYDTSRQTSSRALLQCIAVTRGYICAIKIQSDLGIQRDLGPLADRSKTALESYMAAAATTRDAFTLAYGAFKKMADEVQRGTIKITTEQHTAMKQAQQHFETQLREVSRIDWRLQQLAPEANSPSAPEPHGEHIPAAQHARHTSPRPPIPQSRLRRTKGTHNLKRPPQQRGLAERPRGAVVVQVQSTPPGRGRGPTL